MQDNKHPAAELAAKLDSDTQPTWVWVERGGGYRNTGNVTRPLSAKAASMLRTIPALEADRDALRVQVKGFEVKYKNAMRSLRDAVTERDALQAKLDQIMMEHCPEEMTPEQIAEWGRHQVAVVAPQKSGAA